MGFTAADALGSCCSSKPSIGYGDLIEPLQQERITTFGEVSELFGQPESAMLPKDLVDGHSLIDPQISKHLLSSMESEGPPETLPDGPLSSSDEREECQAMAAVV
ncbi:hypothetical protein [Sphingomonas mollis]|uniref:Uncharacterized protein n=1 Tax=Sphingomonas mollis TaxID=2795726 RepID=A0ABS0XSG5_9SPHN|nr:hypothetical protein [Sphingomonas sp. BT553]MBJ6122999.1 hypothetical protein [Sphingomonas sp. BT553]